jgi:hypothetical protein
VLILAIVCGVRPTRQSRGHRYVADNLGSSCIASSAAECRLFFLASTGALQKQSVMKGKGPVMLPASQHQWTSKARDVTNLGVHPAMVITSLLISRSQPAIDTFDTKGTISRSHPDTSPIYFYDRGKPFFECARTLLPDALRKRYCTYVLRSDLRTSLCTRLSMMKRSTLPQSTVRSEAMSCSCNDDPLCSLSSIQVHDH